VLEEQRIQALSRMSDGMYRHVWLGEYLKNSDAQIFNGKWRIAEFEPKPFWDGPYLGLDFGFSQDPTAAVECYVFDECLHIYAEAGGVGIELDDTAKEITSKIPLAATNAVRADSARPESISYLKKHGLNRIESVHKWSGSVEDGIEFIRSFREIVIHPKCKNMIDEARMYSYKVDRLSGDVTTKIEDKHNHYWDAVRYALAPLIKRRGEPRLRSL
jgi:phage terminase large subunit